MLRRRVFQALHRQHCLNLIYTNKCFPPVPTGCADHEFQCDNGQCIDAKRTCDRVNDCDDASDEKDCGMSTLTTRASAWLLQ